MEKIFIICGKSGSGKDFIAKTFGLKVVTGNTTRQPRPSDGDTYNYHSHYEAEEILYNFDLRDPYFREISDYETSDFLFDVDYVGNFYWTWKKDFDNPRYKSVIVELDGIKKVLQILAHEKVKNIRIFNRDVKIVYIKSSVFKRIKNMRSRGDSWKKIFERIRNDAKTFKNAENYLEKKQKYFPDLITILNI